MPKPLMSDASAVIPKARTGFGRPVSSSHDFVPVVKGSVVPPGEKGFPNVVPVGNRQAFNQAFDEGASFWWNLGGDNPKDIHSIAFGSIKYTSPGGLQEALATPQMAEGYGITLPQLREAVGNVRYRRDQSKVGGKIVFARAPKINSAYYEGGGESLAEGVQVGSSVVPTRTMDIPENLEYSDPHIFKIKKRNPTDNPRSFNHADDLKGVEFHDFMKTFSENVKAVAPEGAALPQGTQRYLDLPFTKDANEAIERYFKERLPERRLSNPMIESFDVDTSLHEDGAERFAVSAFDPVEKKRIKGSIKKDDLFAFLKPTQPQASQSELDAAVNAALGVSEL